MIGTTRSLPPLDEASLRRSEAIHRATIETMAEAVIVLDGEGEVLTLNSAFAAMHGYGSLTEAYDSLWQFQSDVEAEDLEGRPIPKREWPGDRALRGETVRQFALRSTNRVTGRSFVGSYSAVPVITDGRLEYVVITIHDLTALMEAQEAQRRQERLLRRTEEQLRERLEELAQADREKDEFLALLSHELRNPLAGIANALYLLNRLGSQEPRVQELRGLIERQIRYLNRLLEDLLDVTRLTRGLIEMRREPADLRSVVERAIDATHAVMDVHGHRLLVDLPDPLPVDGDPVRLEQVLVNLLTNAAKYTDEEGEIEITSVLEPEHLLLRVRDNGMGIDGALLPRVFDLFTQADRSHTRTHGGLGIGLTLVRRIVELHGGTVSAESDGLGEGSCFTIRLPCGAAEPPPVAVAAPAAEPARALRVLVIEDNRDAAETMCDLLEMAGHQVDVAYTGPAGVRQAATFGPDVVLCDIGLPGMDGYAVARALHDGGILGAARLIALTGFGQPDDRRRTAEAGFHAHLTKPADPEEVLRLIAGLAVGPLPKQPSPSGSTAAPDR